MKYGIIQDYKFLLYVVLERSKLRASTGMRYALLIPILDELVREGRIRSTLGKDGHMIFLISR
jgi:hypothetical protein